MTQNQSVGKLVTAVRLIRDVRATLQTSKEKCPCCGCAKYDDKEEWMMAQALDACLGRLPKIIQSLKDSRTV